MSTEFTGDLDALSLTAKARRQCEALPQMCFAFLEGALPGERIVAIRRGEKGCYRTSLDDAETSVDQARELVDTMNRKLCISDEEREAMLGGSMFGWDTAAAQPERYRRSVVQLQGAAGAEG